MFSIRRGETLKNLQRKRLFILGLGVLIAVLIISMINDNKRTEQILIVNGEIDRNIPLSEQTSAFKIVRISQKEAGEMMGTLVRSIDELSNKKLLQDLEIGSPIPKSLLVDLTEQGEFTSQVLKNRTYYKLDAMLPNLPPGVQKGDKVDIFLQYNVKEYNDIIYHVDLLLEGVEIGLIQEQTVYLDVSQKEYNILQAASNIGQFVVQVPGMKDAEDCINVPESEHGKVECISEDDKATDISTIDVKELLGKDKNTKIENIFNNENEEESDGDDENDDEDETEEEYETIYDLN